ncbi:MAG: alpha/beta hydrolase [Acidimicrobiia bacterium]
MTTTSTIRRIRTVGVDVTAGITRAVRYVQSLRSASAPTSLWTRVRLSASAVTDEALLTTFQVLRSPPDSDHFAERLDDARNLLDFLGTDTAAAGPVEYHQRPQPVAFSGAERRVGHVRFLHAQFLSGYAPTDATPGAARFRQQTGNRIVHAWVLAHVRPAPWIVCVHGAGMGDPLADIFAFRAGALHRAGFNVAIPVLPHHGPRGAGRLAVAFPTDDPVLNFHGAAQAIADVRAVLATIEPREEPAMLLGISLGSYVAAAVAALEPNLRGIVIGVPVVDLSELLVRHAPDRFTHHPLFRELRDASRALERYSSPLTLPVPATTVRRVWAGIGDRLVQPDQVARIVDHWGNTETCWYTGGHMGFLGLPRVGRFTHQAIVDAGLGELRGGCLRARPLDAIPMTIPNA